MGGWSLLTATFDGKTQRLYVNGKLLASHASTFDRIPEGGRFTIGMVAGRADAGDPAYRNTARFEGLIDEVRVFDRVLSAEEIAGRAQASSPHFELAEDYQTSPVAATLRAGTVTIGVGDTGELQLACGNDRYVLNSYVAYPGEIGRLERLLRFCARASRAGSRRCASSPTRRLRSAAQGRSTRLQRQVEVKDEAVEIADTLRNLSPEPVGIMTRHDLICSDRLKQSFSAGGAETPFMYVQGPQSALGLLMEDDLSRLRFEPRTAVRSQRVQLPARQHGAGYRQVRDSQVGRLPAAGAGHVLGPREPDPQTVEQQLHRAGAAGLDRHEGPAPERPGEAQGLSRSANA